MEYRICVNAYDSVFEIDKFPGIGILYSWEIILSMVKTCDLLDAQDLKNYVNNRIS